MKKLLSLVFVSAIAGALLLSSQTKGNAQQHQRQHSTVMFSIYAGSGNDLKIYYTSKSGPGIPELSDDPATAINQLRDAGFEMHQAPDPVYMFLR